MVTPNSRKRRVGVGSEVGVGNNGSDAVINPKKPKSLLSDQAINTNFDYNLKAEPSYFDNEVDLTVETEDNFEYDENDRPTEVYSPNVNQIVQQHPHLIDNRYPSEGHPPPLTGFPLSDVLSPSSKTCGAFVPLSKMRFHPLNDMRVVIEDLNLPAQKIEFLQSCHDTEKLFVKGE